MSKIDKLRETPIFLLVKKFSAPFRLFREMLHDGKRFKRASFYFSESRPSLDNIRGELSFESHAIEKGLMHKNFRPNFGKKHLDRLVALLDIYQKRGYTKDDSRYRNAVSVLDAYVKKHKKLGIPVEKYSDALLKYALVSQPAGVLLMNAESTLKKSREDFSNLSMARHSVREFGEQQVSDRSLREAFELSERTPSVCNRQGWKVYVTQNSKTMKLILDTQAGINGMAQNVSAVEVVTVDESYFGNITERNQAFIDGGIYVMNLLYSLTYVGLASCTLNTDFNMKIDSKMRKILSINDNEVFIAVIAIGTYPENYLVPVSNRDKYTEYVTFI